jgi:hypothetical protein
MNSITTGIGKKASAQLGSIALKPGLEQNRSQHAVKFWIRDPHGKTPRSYSSKSWRRRFGWTVPGVGPNNLHLAFIDSVAAGRKQHIETLTTKGKVREPAIQCRNNALHLAGLIADLVPKFVAT